MCSDFHWCIFSFSIMYHYHTILYIVWYVCILNIQCTRWCEAGSMSEDVGPHEFQSWKIWHRVVVVGGGGVAVKFRVANTWSGFSCIISLFFSLIKLVLLVGEMAECDSNWGKKKKNPVLHQVKSFLSEEVLLWEALILYFTFFLLIWLHESQEISSRRIFRRC